jgi:hypothetical protein
MQQHFPTLTNGIIKSFEKSPEGEAGADKCDGPAFPTVFVSVARLLYPGFLTDELNKTRLVAFNTLV